MDLRFKQIIVEENNDSDIVNQFVLHIRADRSLDIELLDEDNKYLGCINTVRIKNKDDESIECIYIEDIRIVHINQGHGTELLQRLIKHCKDNHIDFIYGNLSKFDYKDHQERLVHFYIKNGFEVLIFPKISNNGIDVGQIKYDMRGKMNEKDRNRENESF